MSILDVEERRIRAAYARRAAKTGRSIYSCFNSGNLFMVQERERQTLELLWRHGLSDLKRYRILEVGCGSGVWLRESIRWGARPENIVGVDLLPEQVAEARSLCPSSVGVLVGSAAQLGFADASFDIILQSKVFSSILDPFVRRSITQEMLRVLKPGGSILWYVFFLNNPRNPDVQGVGKKEIIRMFPPKFKGKESGMGSSFISRLRLTPAA